MLELAGRYTVLKKVGDGIYGGRCPNPSHIDKDPSFTVFQKKQSWCCYGCHNGNKHKGKTHNDTNYGSDCFAFLQWVSEGKISWKQAVLQLAKENNITIPKDEYEEMYNFNLSRAKAYTLNLTGDAFNYLVKRGLNKKDMEEWMIGFDGLKIVFPLLDRYKKVLGFSRRWLVMPDWCRDKYRNSPTSEIFNKSFYFYGIHNYDSTYPYIYITEGPMDVILAHKYGLTNIMATQGTSFTDNHAEIIKNFNKTPVFIMDGDSAGLKALNKSTDKLSKLGIYSKIVLLNNGEDLAELSNRVKYDLNDYIESHMITYSYYKVQHIFSKYNSALLELEMKLRPELKDIIDTIPENEKDLMIDFISDKMHINLREDKISGS